MCTTYWIWISHFFYGCKKTLKKKVIFLQDKRETISRKSTCVEIKIARFKIVKVRKRSFVIKINQISNNLDLFLFVIMIYILCTFIIFVWCFISLRNESKYLRFLDTNWMNTSWNTRNRTNLKKNEHFNF